MEQPLIADEWLDELRKIGDPQLNSTLLAAAKLFEPEDLIKKVQTNRLLSECTELATSAFTVVPGLELDVDKVRRAQRLFATYGTEIAGALLLAALPQSYAAQWGSRVLVATTRLHEDFRRRIVGTAQFLVIAMRGADSDRQAREFWTQPDREAEKVSMHTPWKACLAVRLYHEAIRMDLADKRAAKGGKNRTARLLGPQNDPPLNQEDLLGTLLAFTVTVFEVLERYGLAWTAEDQEAYLYAWDVIGAHLGIGNDMVIRELSDGFKQRLATEGWVGLRPPTLAATRLLLDQLRKRQWTPLTSGSSPVGGGPTEWEGTRAGRVLVRALLDELAAAMPRLMQGLPIAVMRALAPNVVRDRLGLGGGGLVFSLLGLLPKRQALVDRFTALPVANPVGGAALRTLANQVTTQVIVRFIRRSGLQLPDLEDWSDGLSDPMHTAAIH
jgi:hypothetical protein